jgi:hypothetical protein
MGMSILTLFRATKSRRLAIIHYLTLFAEESSMSHSNQAMDSISGDDDAAFRGLIGGAEPLMHSPNPRCSNYNMSTPAFSQMATANQTKNNDSEHVFHAEPPPELEQETMMNTEHRQVLAKLRFVLELIEVRSTMLFNHFRKLLYPLIIYLGVDQRGRKQKQSDSNDDGRRGEENGEF